MITSRQNSEFKELLKLSQRKFRRREGLFLAEGLRLVKDGLEAGWAPEKIVISSPLLSQEGLSLVEGLDYPILELAPELMELASDTETSQGILAVFPVPEYTLDSIAGDLVLVLDGLRDPGNAGALFRSASAVGGSGIIALEGTVDFSSPKVLRASMGGVFRVPWVENVTTSQLLDWLDKGDFTLLGLEPRGGVPFYKYDYRKNLALVVGNEAQGVNPELVQVCQENVTIPMPGGSESLNASMAATLVLYQALIGRGL